MPEAAPVIAKSWPLILCGGPENVLCGLGLTDEEVLVASDGADMIALERDARECVKVPNCNFANFASDGDDIRMDACQ